MKYSKIAIWAIMIGATFASCKNTNEDLVAQRGKNVVPIFNFTSAPVFTTDLESSSVEFTVSLNEGDEVDKVSIEVLYNGENATIMQEFSSLPSTITLKAIDIINQMGLNKDNISTSDVFSMFVLTTKGGNTTRSIASANIKIVCAFDTDLTQGEYDAVSKDWQGAAPVTLVADEANPYKIYVQGLNDVDGVSGVDDVFFEIDPESYEITNRDEFVLSEDLSAEWGDDYAGYTNYSYAIVSGSYNSCDGSYIINFDIFCDLGDFGVYQFVFTKK